MNKKFLWLGLIALAILIGLGVWLWNRSNSGGNLPGLYPAASVTPTNNSGVNVELDGSVGLNSQVREFIVEASNFRFAPSELRVKKGDLVRLTIRNSQGEHDFQLDEFAISSRVLKAGEEQLLEFTPTTAGTFEYYCSINNHRAMGMVGRLIVEE